MVLIGFTLQVPAFVVSGGFSKTLSNLVWTLERGAEKWTSLEPLPQNLYGGKASIVGGRLRITGGYSVEGYSSKVISLAIRESVKYCLAGLSVNGGAPQVRKIFRQKIVRKGGGRVAPLADKIRQTLFDSFS